MWSLLGSTGELGRYCARWECRASSREERRVCVGDDDDGGKGKVVRRDWRDLKRSIVGTARLEKLIKKVRGKLQERMGELETGTDL